MVNNYYSSMCEIICQERNDDDVSATKIRNCIRNDEEDELSNLHKMSNEHLRMIIERIKNGSTNNTCRR